MVWAFELTIINKLSVKELEAQKHISPLKLYQKKKKIKIMISIP